MATVQRLAGYRVDSWGQPIDEAVGHYLAGIES